jgi:hypothetical protein
LRFLLWARFRRFDLHKLAAPVVVVAEPAEAEAVLVAPPVRDLVPDPGQVQGRAQEQGQGQVRGQVQAAAVIAAG